MEFISVPEAAGGAFALPSWALIAVALVAGVLLIYSFLTFRRNRAELRQQWQQEDEARHGKPAGTAQSASIPTAATFKAKQVMTRKSLDVLELLENAMWDLNSSFSVLVNCDLGRFLTQGKTGTTPAAQQRIQPSIKSEILDYLVINGDGLPILGVIYYTDGPSNSTRTKEDQKIPAIVAALNQAGIRFIDIDQNFRKRDLKKRLKKVMKSSVL